jgi:hypothetical protein
MAKTSRAAKHKSSVATETPAASARGRRSADLVTGNDHSGVSLDAGSGNAGRIGAKTPAHTPESDEIEGKDGETVQNSPVNESTRSRARARDPETGNLLLRPGQASIGSRLDDELEQKIVSLIASGQTWTDACLLCDLDRTTAYKWKARGEEEPESRYGLFLQRINKAEVACKAIWVQKVARSDQWQAQAFLLKAKWPAEFIERTELVGAEGAPLALGNAFNVIIQAPPADPNEIWKTVDHRGDKSDESSLAEVIANHKPSEVLPDPVEHYSSPAERSMPGIKVNPLDPLGSRGGAGDYIKPKSEGTKIRR